MIIEYEEFLKHLNLKIKSGDDFYFELLKTVIENPTRYSGLYRLSNGKTKLIQNVTQSNEIKFGDFMEEIVTKYISILGYTNLEKYLGFDASGDKLYADQIFIKNNVVYLVEQKIRDDHDSTKKRGQYSNFDKKVRLLESKYGNMRIIAIMWFIDDGLKKNINYYLNEMKNSKYKDTEIHLYYGSEFFSSLENGDKAWQELCSHLRMNRKQNSGEIITIPDFGSSAEIYNALLKLPQKHWNKLLSNDKQYILLRDEMFSTGSNLDRAKKARS